MAASPGGTTSASTRWRSRPFGNVCVATLIHGGITVVSPTAAAVEPRAAARPLRTNLCFGGPDLRTAYVTLSGSGRLIAFDDWPVPGLALNYAV